MSRKYVEGEIVIEEERKEQQETGIKKSSLQEGIRVLIKERYLIQRPGTNIYDFYEIPQEEKQEDITIHINDIQDKRNFKF